MLTVLRILLYHVGRARETPLGGWSGLLFRCERRVPCTLTYYDCLCAFFRSSFSSWMVTNPFIRVYGLMTRLPTDCLLFADDADDADDADAMLYYPSM